MRGSVCSLANRKSSRSLPFMNTLVVLSPFVYFPSLDRTGHEGHNRTGQTILTTLSDSVLWHLLVKDFSLWEKRRDGSRVRPPRSSHCRSYRSRARQPLAIKFRDGLRSKSLRRHLLVRDAAVKTSFELNYECRQESR